jgi:hypothetical protein
VDTGPAVCLLRREVGVSLSLDIDLSSGACGSGTCVKGDALPLGKWPKMSEQLLVRFATLSDLEFVSQDHYVSAEIVRHKIEWHEVMVAEQNKQLIGYLRLEYLWSIIPYIALIRVIPEYRRQGVSKACLTHSGDI